MLGPSPRLLPAPEESPASVALARRGGRAFVAGGELVLALPGAGGPEVLVPRGFGHPLVAVREGGALRAVGTGAPCNPARWVSVGGVAARVREVALPRGPAAPLSADEAMAGEGRWMCVRTEPLAWAAARLADPSVTHGAVAVAGPRVRAASARAARAGVARGMSVALARRRCPDLRVVSARGVGEVEAAVERVLAGARRVAGGWLLRLPEGAGAELADRALRRLWQRAGVEAAAAVATRADDAVGLARVLRPGQVGEVPAAAAGAWARRSSPGRWWSGQGGAAWQGTPIPDVDGAVARARALATAVGARGGALRVALRGDRGAARATIPLPDGCEASMRDALVDAGLRRALAEIGEVASIRVLHAGIARSRPAARAPRQLALLPGVR